MDRDAPPRDVNALNAAEDLLIIRLREAIREVATGLPKRYAIHRDTGEQTDG